MFSIYELFAQRTDLQRLRNPSVFPGCSEDIMTSDHSPLFSNFQVGVRGQYISKDGE